MLCEDAIHPSRRHPGAAARCSPGASRRATPSPPAGAIRASSSWCCAARWTGSRRCRRSAIPAMSRCARALPCRPPRRRGPAARRLLRPPSRHAEPCPAYQAKQAAIVHATATGYRERSHFDGQDVLESGQPRPGLTQSGWLNRAIALLPPGERIGAKGALGIGAMPPGVRGQAPVLGWAPQGLQQADDDVARRVLQLYDEREPRLAAALRQGLDTSRMASASGLGACARARAPPIPRAWRSSPPGPPSSWPRPRRAARRRTRPRGLGHPCQCRRRHRPARHPPRRARPRLRHLRGGAEGRSGARRWWW